MKRKAMISQIKGKNKRALGLAGIFTLLVFIFIQGNAQTVGPVELSKVGSFGEGKLSKAPKKVYISEFRVMYQLLYHQKDEDRGGRTLGGGLRGDAVASITVGIKGVDAPDLQELTNKLYADYTSKLKSEGFELVEAAEAAKTETLSGWELIEGGTPNEAQFKGYLMTTPAGYSYLVRRVTESGKEKKGFLDPSPKISRDLGGAIVAKVNILVPMVEDGQSVGGKMLSDAAAGVAKVVLRPNLRISSEAVSAGTFSTDLATTSCNFYYMKSMGEQASVINTLKKTVEISGVLPDNKYKATAVANTDNWGTEAGYFRIFNVNDEEVKNLQVIECDRNQYINGVSDATGKFLNASLNQFLSNIK